MDSVEQIYHRSGSVADFAKGYVRYVSELLERLDPQDIAQLMGRLGAARRAGTTIFVIGNGGSAATATHMACDLGMDVLKKTGSSSFRVLALTDNNALMTAIGNDSGYENLFLNQLRIHFRPGDTLIAISASGNSPNLLEAARWVRQNGGEVLAFVGFDGGKLKDEADAAVHVQTDVGEYGPVEDLHMVIGHLMANWFIHYLKNTTEESHSPGSE